MIFSRSTPSMYALTSNSTFIEANDFITGSIRVRGAPITSMPDLTSSAIADNSRTIDNKDAYHVSLRSSINGGFTVQSQEHLSQAFMTYNEVSAFAMLLQDALRVVVKINHNISYEDPSRGPVILKGGRERLIQLKTIRFLMVSLKVKSLPLTVV